MEVAIGVVAWQRSYASLERTAQFSAPLSTSQAPHESTGVCEVKVEISVL